MPLEIFARVAFLISIAGLGYGVGRALKLSSKDIAALLIYVIAPVVIFISIMQSRPTGPISHIRAGHFWSPAVRAYAPISWPAWCGAMGGQM